MAKSKYVGANVVANYDTYATWVDKTNQIIYDLSTSVLTVNTGAVADITTGNAYVNGYFGSDSLYAITELRGGNNTVANTLTISSNVAMSSGNKITIGATSINSTFYTGTSNNSNYLGGSALSDIQSDISANASAAYANAVANAAAVYQTKAGLSANVLTLTSNNSNRLLDFTWTSPGIIGSVAPNTGYFSVLHSNNHVYLDKNASYVYGTLSDSSTQIRMAGVSTGNAVYTGAIDAGPVSVLVHAPTGSPLRFYSNGTYQGQFDVSGNLKLGSTAASVCMLDVVGGIKSSRSLVTGTPADSDGNLMAGTYTPTISGITSISTSTAYTCQYSRCGDVITVSGRVDIVPSATGVISWGITLPIVSNFTSVEQCGGSGGAVVGSNLVSTFAYANATTDVCNMKTVVSSTGSANINFSFTYQVR